MEAKRIEFIDAMRGFTMLLVVYSHIIFFSYSNSFSDDISLGGDSFLSFNALFILFRMPLFFFISGFILYKKDFIWNLTNSMLFLLKKSKVQLIPTFFFMYIYSFVMNISYENACCLSSKLGYWFTIALFEYFILYAVYRILFNRIEKKVVCDLLLLGMGILLYFAATPTCLKILHIFNSPFCGILGLDYLKYFLFFVVGILARKHFDVIKKYLDNGFISGFVILVFFGITIYVLHHGYFANTLYIHLFLILSGLLGIVIMFSFFRKYECSFTKNTSIGKFLQYIGKHTLDIYLLHYFFIPRNLGVIGRFFNENSNPILELVVSMIIALLVVGICLLLSKIIRISPILAHWLFGAK